MTGDDIRNLVGSLTDLDTALRISDFSNETLLALAQRLERSTRPRHFLLREAELDDIWRYVEATLSRAPAAGEDAASIASLERLLALVMQAHDLAGDGEMVRSAATLRSAMVPEGHAH